MSPSPRLSPMLNAHHPLCIHCPTITHHSAHSRIPSPPIPQPPLPSPQPSPLTRPHPSPLTPHPSHDLTPHPCGRGSTARGRHSLWRPVRAPRWLGGAPRPREADELQRCAGGPRSARPLPLGLRSPAPQRDSAPGLRRLCPWEARRGQTAAQRQWLRHSLPSSERRCHVPTLM